MKRPKKIKIGPFVFGVSFATKKPRMINKDEEKIGELSLQKLLIWIKQSNHTIEAETLIHEILHGIFAVSGITNKFSYEEEEEVISALSPYILMVLRDNPKLVEFILKESNEL